MKPAAGFAVDLVASEPAIRQPVTMSFDDRGRLWVIQYLQYPNPAGLKPVKTDRYLRTTYDRIPDPPPRGPRGADRITICEDTDGDGRMDKFKDFVTGLNLASGMALAADGVYVAQAPYLLFFPDRDRDDVADSDPEVLLSGFGLEDAHAVVNSLVWGPDGWLYGAQGSTVTAHIRGITFQQGVWRYHPPTRRFELFAEGGGNTWGLDFDRHGNVICGTNWGGYAMLHMVQGGYYVKGFEKHGPLQNPHAYGYFHHVPYRQFRGGHVTCGGVIYRGGVFPAAFDDCYVAANLLSNAIHWHRLIPDRSTFRAEWGGELMTTDDPCFRPIDCLVGPDGLVYVADWYDKRANHVDPVDDWDKSSGRIYRIRPDSREVRQAAKLARRPPTEPTEVDRQVATIRRLGDANDDAGAAKLPEIAGKSAHVAVRCQLACSARRFRTSLALAIVRELALREEDVVDPLIPLLLWWAIESKCDWDRSAVMDLLCDVKLAASRMVRTHLIGRMARRLVSNGKPEDWSDCARLLRTFQGDEIELNLMDAIDLGSAGRRFRGLPNEIAREYQVIARRHSRHATIIRLNVRFQVDNSIDRALACLVDPKIGNETKEKVAAELATLGSVDAKVALLRAFKENSTSNLATTLVAALERFPETEIPRMLLAGFAKRPAAVQNRIVAALLSRSNWATILLDAIDDGVVPQKSIADANLQSLAGFHDSEIAGRVRKRWGNIKPPSAGEVRARIHGICVTVRMAKGDPSRGQALFKEHCGICHKLHGQGNAVGPDLTGLERKNLEFLVSNIVEPSAVIRKEYTPHVVSTNDGRVLSGLIAEQSADAITLLDAKNQRTVISRGDIEAVHESDVSIMPDKLLDKLDHQQIRDLFAYLQHVESR